MIILYLHIGAEKTGTTAIQQFLLKNRRLLHRQGYCYVGQGLLPQGKPSLNHCTFFKNFHSLKPAARQQRFNQILASWKQFSQNSNIRKYIVSWESLGLDSHFIRLLSSQSVISVRPIMYIRRQDAWLESGWKQYGCKIEGCETVHDWVRYVRENDFWREKVDWYERLQKIEKSFVKDSIIVKVYDQISKEKGLFRDFCEAIGVTWDNDFSLSLNPQGANPGLNNEYIEIVKLCRVLLTGQYDESISQFLIEHSPKIATRDEKSKKLLGYKERVEIMEYYQASNRMVAEKFFNKANDAIFEPVAPIADSDVEKAAGLTVGKIVPIFIEMIMKQDNKIKALENIVSQLNEHAGKDS